MANIFTLKWLNEDHTREITKFLQWTPLLAVCFRQISVMEKLAQASNHSRGDLDFENLLIML